VHQKYAFEIIVAPQDTAAVPSGSEAISFLYEHLPHFLKSIHPLSKEVRAESRLSKSGGTLLPGKEPACKKSRRMPEKLLGILLLR